MGCNCVEKYVPLNFYDPKKGEFGFQGEKDVTGFIKLAKELGGLVILRSCRFILSGTVFSC